MCGDGDTSQENIQIMQIARRRIAMDLDPRLEKGYGNLPTIF
jgi:hypothetical protein